MILLQRADTQQVSTLPVPEFRVSLLRYQPLNKCRRLIAPAANRIVISNDSMLAHGIAHCSDRRPLNDPCEGSRTLDRRVVDEPVLRSITRPRPIDHT